MSSQNKLAIQAAADASAAFDAADWPTTHPALSALAGTQWARLIAAGGAAHIGDAIKRKAVATMLFELVAHGFPTPQPVADNVAVVPPKFLWIFHGSCSHEVLKILEHMKRVPNAYEIQCGDLGKFSFTFLCLHMRDD